jgi:hypothetical protein
MDAASAQEYADMAGAFRQGLSETGYNWRRERGHRVSLNSVMLAIDWQKTSCVMMKKEWNPDECRF